MRRRVRPLARVLLAVMAAGCARTEREVAATVAGCYSMHWFYGDTLISAPGLPDSIRLDTALTCPSCLDGQRAMRIAYAGHGQQPEPVLDIEAPGLPRQWDRLYSTATWVIAGRDSVRMVFNDNYTGYILGLEIKDDELRGTARFTTHEGGVPPAPPNPVTAGRFPCPLD